MKPRILIYMWPLFVAKVFIDSAVFKVTPSTNSVVFVPILLVMHTCVFALAHTCTFTQACMCVCMGTHACWNMSGSRSRIMSRKQGTDTEGHEQKLEQELRLT